MRVVIVVVAVVVLGACASQHHVRLDPPRHGITPDERVELFWKLRPTSQWQVTSNDDWVNETMVLGDRRGVDEIEVVSPEDLEPLVGRDSETMKHARRSVAARKKARSWAYVAGAAFVSGLVLSIALREDEPTFGPSKSWIGLGVGFGGVAIAMPISRRHARKELTWRKRAFAAYARDLGMTLNVCAQGMRVVPCEDEPAPTDPR